MKKADFFKRYAGKVVIFGERPEAGEVETCRFLSADPDITVSEINYKNAAGEDASMQIARVPMLVGKSKVINLTLNDDLNYLLMTGKPEDYEKTYQVEAKESKSGRTFWEFHIPETEESSFTDAKKEEVKK